MVKKESEKRRNHVCVLAGAALFQLALVGVLINSNGVLLTQLRTEYGFSMTRISAFNMLRCISGAVLAPVYSSLFFRYDKAKTMFGSVVLIACGYLLLIIGADTWLWYLAPCFMSCTTSIGVFAISYVVRPWFPQSYGTASGFAMAFSGVGGVVFSPVIAQLIVLLGWRWAVIIMGAVMLVTASTGLWLLFRRSPELVYGESGPAQMKKTKPNGKKFLFHKFFLCILCLMGAAFCLQLVSYINLYAQSIGYSLVAGAALTSFVMGGNIIGKLIYGVSCDWFGVWKTTSACSLLVAAGVWLTVLAPGSYPAMCIGAVLLGFAYSISTLALSRCCIAAYGAAESARYVGIHSGINSALGALVSMGSGLLYDKIHTFVPVFAAGAVITMVSAITAAAMSIKESGRRRK